MPTTPSMRAARRRRNEIHDYVNRAKAHAEKLLSRSGYAKLSTHDKDDVTSRVMDRVWLGIDHYPHTYANPEVLVEAMLPRVVIDLYRRNGAQRGEGARHTRKIGDFESSTFTTALLGDISRLDPEAPMPQVRTRQTYDPTQTQSLTASELPDTEDVIGRLDAEDTCALMDAALLVAGVTKRGLYLLHQVDGEGRTVVDVAAELRIDRATAQRQLGKVRAEARTSLAQWQADSTPDASAFPPR